MLLFIHSSHLFIHSSQLPDNFHTIENVDATNFDCRTWPRASVVGVRLWGLGQTFQSRSFYPSLNTCSSIIASLKPSINNGSCSSSNNNYSNSNNDNNNSNNSRETNKNDKNNHKFNNRNYIIDQILELTYHETLHLYITYIRYHHYLSRTVGLNLASIIFHYPLYCSNKNINNFNDIEQSFYPSTKLKNNYCQNNKRRYNNEIYSEEMLSELKAYR